MVAQREQGKFRLISGVKPLVWQIIMKAQTDLRVHHAWKSSGTKVPDYTVAKQLLNGSDLTVQVIAGDLQIVKPDSLPVFVVPTYVQAVQVDHGWSLEIQPWGVSVDDLPLPALPT